MTVYATEAELSLYAGADELVRLSDRDGSGTADAGVIDAALVDASSTIDSYIARWLPLSEVPAVLRRHCMAIAVYSLANNSETEDQRKRFEDAMQWLRDVSKGVASLGIPPAAEGGAASGVVQFSYADRAMTRTSLRGCW